MSLFFCYFGGKLSVDMDNDVSLVGTCDTELKDKYYGIFGSIVLKYKF